MGNSFSKMKKQARQLEQQVKKMQEEMQNLSVTGVAGNGLVKIVLRGDHRVEKVSIDPECIDSEDPEGLEDLIKAAFEDGCAQIEKQSNDSFGSPASFGGFPF